MEEHINQQNLAWSNIYNTMDFLKNQVNYKKWKKEGQGKGERASANQQNSKYIRELIRMCGPYL